MCRWLHASRQISVMYVRFNVPLIARRAAVGFWSAAMSEASSGVLGGPSRRKRRMLGGSAIAPDGATDGGTDESPPKPNKVMQFINDAVGHEAVLLGPLKEVLCVLACARVCVGECKIV